MIIKQQLNITDFVKKVYFAYFDLKLGDQDKVWAPHKVCKRCVEDLRNWSRDKKKAFRYAIPMVWREQKNHSDECYCCSCNVKGYNSKRKQSISYPNLQSAIRPIPHGIEMPVFKRNYCPDCTDQPGFCIANCFRVFHNYSIVSQSP